MSFLPDNYQHIISSLKDKIRLARQRASLAVNKELLSVYWEIGAIILQQQQQEKWGTKIIERLSIDLKTEFPDFKGLSVRNLKYMRTFAETFPTFPNGDRLMSESQAPDQQVTVIGQQAAAQLPWGHIQVLLDKVKHEEMTFYIQHCVDNGWSRNILIEQISSRLFQRKGNAITNFKDTLPSVQSDLAQETFKNPYIFDFISLTEETRERELENALIKHLKNFMLELGKGFAYVGRQKNLVVNGDDFILDLLFYNYHLHCFVVFELKIGEFKPEFAGKLNFYVNTINGQLKGPDDKETIGVLLCKTPNETVVRYSLQGIESPIGVADYQLAQALPRQLKAEMPTIEELEAEIDKEYEELKDPMSKKLDTLREKLASLKQPEVRVPVSYEILCKLHDQSLIPLFKRLISRLEAFHSDFMSYDYLWTGTETHTKLEDIEKDWRNENYLKTNRDHFFQYRLSGLKAAGVDTFDVTVRLNYIITYPYWYGFSLMNHNNQQPIIRRLYSDPLGPTDIELVCDTVSDYIINEIDQRIGFIQKDSR
jgi:predicted nuclease of restriction endonuclease-like (RecB) superfamily